LARGSQPPTPLRAAFAGGLRPVLTAAARRARWCLAAAKKRPLSTEQRNPRKGARWRRNQLDIQSPIQGSSVTSCRLILLILDFTISASRRTNRCPRNSGAAHPPGQRSFTRAPGFGFGRVQAEDPDALARMRRVSPSTTAAAACSCAPGVVDMTATAIRPASPAQSATRITSGLAALAGPRASTRGRRQQSLRPTSGPAEPARHDAEQRGHRPE